MKEIAFNKEYKNWLIDLKSKIRNSQIKAALKVNSELIKLYWDMGAMIVEKQKETKWGSGFIQQLSLDLKQEFPGVSGFSIRNLYSIKQFYLFYSEHITIMNQVGAQIENDFVNQVGAQIELVSENSHKVDENVNSKYKLLLNVPWRHNVLILQKTKNINEALFYISETINNNWSRSVLEYQIETNLFQRQGKAVSNFERTLPKAEGDLAQQLLKDPFNFEFLTLSKEANEKELEDKLIDNITQFLLELGKGFAYMGRQFPIKVGNKEYRTDLLFYHTRLKSYVIIELKMKEFEPEFVGKLNFYLTAINELVKDDLDKPSIGILLCKNKENYIVDFSLKDINKPIGVSEFTYNELPEEIKKAIPSDQEFTKLIKESQ
jgi:predicted nuclease of restriction endonuclease-like (RecB) superfamily